MHVALNALEFYACALHGLQEAGRERERERDRERERHIERERESRKKRYEKG